MYGKKRTETAVGVTESTAQAVLRRGAAPALASLSSEEEKVMRMRLGASLPRTARLEQIATATDAQIEILAYEIEAYLHQKAQRQARAAAPTPRRATTVSAPAPTTSRTKEKIVRALRKKP